MRTVSALFVDPKGPYFGLPDVDPWDEARNALLYNEAHPVVAHPPCARWSVLAGLVESLYGYKRGEDGGCGASALDTVRRCGGVMEHPANTALWPALGLMRPPEVGWGVADWEGGWTCRVSQYRYGHAAIKETWLYAVGCDLPSLDWRRSDREGRRIVRHGEAYRQNQPTMIERMHSSDPRRKCTPEPFRDLLLAMARSVAT